MHPSQAALAADLVFWIGFAISAVLFAIGCGAAA